MKSPNCVCWGEAYDLDLFLLRFWEGTEVLEIVRGELKVGGLLDDNIFEGVFVFLWNCGEVGACLSARGSFLFLALFKEVLCLLQQA